jgi:hypothetical protein
VKKIWFFSVVMVFLSISSYAEMSVSLGVGAEVNTYSSGGIAMGLGGLVDFRINEMWAIGARPLMNIDFGPEGFSVLEVTGNVRWYFLRFKKLLNYYYLWQRRFHLFAEFDFGAAFAYQDISTHLSFSDIVAGVTSGVRIDWPWFYVEPYIRYTAITNTIGAGVLVGATLRQKEELR